MPVLREVVTRFKFEQDKKGVNRFNRTMRGMKNNVRGLARLFGITLGLAAAKTLFTMGISAKKAAFDIERLSGVSMKGLIDQFNIIKNSSKALGGLREVDFFKSGAAFFKIFGGGEKQADQFVKTFKLAAQLSRLTNQNVTDVFTQIGRGIETGDFSFLNEIKGFDKTRIQNIADNLRNIIPTGDYLSGLGRRGRLNEVLNLAAGAAKDINKDLANVPPVMIKSQKAIDKFKDTMDKLATILTDELVPALNNLNQALKEINKLVNFLSKPSTRDLLNPKVFNIPEVPGGGKSEASKAVKDRINRARAYFGGAALGITDQSQRGKGHHRDTVIHNHFNIKGAKTDEIVMEVQKIITDVFRQTNDSLLPTEER